MQSVTFEQWCEWASTGCTRLPAIGVYPGARLPSQWDNLTCSPVSILLESAHGGRYTFVCDRPARVVVGTLTGAEVWSGDFTERVSALAGEPLDVLRGVQTEAKVPRLTNWPTMTGGLMGVVGYDVVHTWERLPRHAKRDVDLPFYVMVEPAELFVFDHQ
ncbi:MAG: hypothetical protein ABIV50_04725, partial [Opitutus sp.]